MENISHSTDISLNLKALRDNLYKIKEYLGKNVKILLIVKKNAYGHGLLPVSLAATYFVDMFGLSTIEEGIKLRKAGIRTPLLLFNYILENEIKYLIKYQIIQSIGDFKLAYKINQLAKKEEKKVKIHIKIDTGMGCLGILANEAVKFIERLRKLKYLEIDGVFSHFPEAEKKDKSFSLAQIECLKNIILTLKKKGLKIPLIHMANSSAILNLKNSYFNMVRPGLMVYGIYPSEDIPKTIKVKPVLSLKTKIVYLKEIPKGQSVSYKRSYMTRQRTKIGIIPIGYADGLKRNLSNCGEVLVKGKRVPIIGKVRMAQTILNLNDVPKVKVGDEVVIIGQQGKEKITIEEMAQKTKLIPYEIVSTLSLAINRVVKNE